jgi:hypothetical protein
MRSDAEGLLHRRTTLRTFLRGVVRCHGTTLAASIFGFALQISSEHAPGCISYSKGQTMVLNHVGGFQAFHDDRLIVLDVVMRGFVQRILALVGNALMNTSHLLPGFLTPVAALLAPCQFLLSLSQFLRTLLGVFGIVDGVSILGLILYSNVCMIPV